MVWRLSALGFDLFESQPAVEPDGVVHLRRQGVESHSFVTNLLSSSNDRFGEFPAQTFPAKFLPDE